MRGRPLGRCIAFVPSRDGIGPGHQCPWRGHASQRPPLCRIHALLRFRRPRHQRSELEQVTIPFVLTTDERVS